MSYLPPCPNCGTALQVSSRPGEKAFCPSCNEIFAIRQATPAPTAAPAPAPHRPPSQVYGPQFGYIPTSGLAVTSLVLGLVALVLFCVWPIAIPCGVIAIILGAFGVSECRGPNPPKNGMGMAVAGIVCSAISVGLYVLVFVFMGISSMRPM